MRILRIDVPEGLTREQKATLQKEIRRCVELTWAKEHVYITIRDMFSEPGDRTTIMTMDLRPGRGHENERAEKLYAMALEVLKQTVPLEARDFVMLIREVPEHGFIVGGQRLPALERITPALPT